MNGRLGDRGAGSARMGNLDGSWERDNQTLAFSTSARQLMSGTRHLMGYSPTGEPGGEPVDLDDTNEESARDNSQGFTGWGAWAEGVLARQDSDTSEIDYGLVYLGVDYRFNPDLVVGVLAQYDTLSETNLTDDYAIEGRGWMVGPYVVSRLRDNLVLDARAAWGTSENSVSPYNSYTDDFETQRWLLRGRLTGDFRLGAFNLQPRTTFVYFHEEQDGYTDSNGNLISSQNIEIGHLDFGPKLALPITRPNGASITPYVALYGNWDFLHSALVDIDTGEPVSRSNDLHARAEAGVTIRDWHGVELRGQAFYDGIGVDDHEAYGGSLRLDLQF